MARGWAGKQGGAVEAATVGISRAAARDYPLGHAVPTHARAAAASLSALRERFDPPVFTHAPPSPSTTRTAGSASPSGVSAMTVLAASLTA